jgi:hypothetical protein
VVPGAVPGREPEPAMNGIFNGSGGFLANGSLELSATPEASIAIGNGTTST